MQQSNRLCVAIIDLFDKVVKTRDVLQLGSAACSAGTLSLGRFICYPYLTKP